jgi:hypothetical protein
MFGLMEEYGILDTKDGLINRVARYLAKSPNHVIGKEEFCQACIACEVNPNSFTQSDLNKLQTVLNKIT